MHGSHLDYFRPVNKIHGKCENAKRITGKTTTAAATATADNKKSQKNVFQSTKTRDSCPGRPWEGKKPKETEGKAIGKCKAAAVIVQRLRATTNAANTANTRPAKPNGSGEQDVD